MTALVEADRGTRKGLGGGLAGFVGALEEVTAALAGETVEGTTEGPLDVARTPALLVLEGVAGVVEDEKNRGGDALPEDEEFAPDDEAVVAATVGEASGDVPLLDVSMRIASHDTVREGIARDRAMASAISLLFCFRRASSSGESPTVTPATPLRGEDVDDELDDSICLSPVPVASVVETISESGNLEDVAAEFD